MDRSNAHEREPSPDRRSNRSGRSSRRKSTRLTTPYTEPETTLHRLTAGKSARRSQREIRALMQQQVEEEVVSSIPPPTINPPTEEIMRRMNNSGPPPDVTRPDQTVRPPPQIARGESPPMVSSIATHEELPRTTSSISLPHREDVFPRQEEQVQVSTHGHTQPLVSSPNPVNTSRTTVTIPVSTVQVHTSANGAGPSTPYLPSRQYSVRDPRNPSYVPVTDMHPTLPMRVTTIPSQPTAPYNQSRVTNPTDLYVPPQPTVQQSPPTSTGITRQVPLQDRSSSGVLSYSLPLPSQYANHSSHQADAHTKRILDTVREWIDKSYRAFVDTALTDAALEHLRRVFEDQDSTTMAVLVAEVTDCMWREKLNPVLPESPLPSMIRQAVEYSLSASELYIPHPEQVLVNNLALPAGAQPNVYPVLRSTKTPGTGNQPDIEPVPPLTSQQDATIPVEQVRNSENPNRRDENTEKDKKNDDDNPDKDKRSKSKSCKKDSKHRQRKRGHDDDDPDSSDSSSSGSSDAKGRKKGGKGKKERSRKRHDSSSSESDSSSSSSDSEGSDGSYVERKQHKLSRKSRGRLTVIRPTLEIFRNAVNYKSYRLIKRSANYQDSGHSRIARLERKMKVQMGEHRFNGSDPITILDFLDRFRETCDKHSVSEGLAMWCFQYFLGGSARALLTSRLTGKSLAIDSCKRETLRSYPEVVNFLLQTYATEDAMCEALEDVQNCRQPSNMDEGTFSQLLWSKAARCGTVFSTNRLRSYFIQNVHRGIRGQVKLFASEHPTAGYSDVLKHAQGLGTDYRVARKISTEPTTNQDRGKPRRRSVMSVQTTETDEDALSDGQDILALTQGSFTTYPSPPSTLTPTASRSSVSFGTTPYSPTPPTYRQPSYSRSGCRLCLDMSHDAMACPHIADPALRQRLYLIRNENYKQRAASREQARQTAYAPTRAAMGNTAPVQASTQANRVYTNRPQIIRGDNNTRSVNEVHEILPEQEEENILSTEEEKETEEQ